MHVRVCRDCGEEYRPEIAVCADCGGRLEDRFGEEGAPRPRPSPPPEVIPAAEDLAGFRPVFVTGHAASLVPLAERLEEAGIAFRLHERDRDPRAPTASFSLLVQEADAAAALRELSPLLASAEGTDRFDAVETAFGAGAYRECPACEAELAGDAAECPECGLGLTTPSALCPRCAAPLDPDAEECAACRAAEG